MKEKEEASKVVLDGPIEEYKKVASMIENAFRNRKKKEKEKEQIQNTDKTNKED